MAAATRASQDPTPGHYLPNAGIGSADEELVEERRPCGHEVDPVFHARRYAGVNIGDLAGPRGVAEHAPHARTRRVEKQPCEGISDQRVFAVGLRSARCGDAQRRRPHTLSDVPGIVVGSRHHYSSHTGTPISEGTRGTLTAAHVWLSARRERRGERCACINPGDRAAGTAHPQLEPDDDLPLGMTLLQVCKRIWDLFERKHPVGHRFQLTAIDQSRQHIKVVSAGMHH